MPFSGGRSKARAGGGSGVHAVRSVRRQRLSRIAKDREGLPADGRLAVQATRVSRCIARFCREW